MHKRCNSRRLYKQKQLLSKMLDFVENILIFSIFIIRSYTRIVMLCWSWNNRTWLMCLIERKRICITVCSRIDLSFRKLKWNRYNSYRILLATCSVYYHRSILSPYPLIWNTNQLRGIVVIYVRIFETPIPMH